MGNTGDSHPCLPKHQNRDLKIIPILINGLLLAGHGVISRDRSILDYIRSHHTLSSAKSSVLHQHSADFDQTGTHVTIRTQQLQEGSEGHLYPNTSVWAPSVFPDLPADSGRGWLRVLPDGGRGHQQCSGNHGRTDILFFKWRGHFSYKIFLQQRTTSAEHRQTEKSDVTDKHPPVLGVLGQHPPKWPPLRLVFSRLERYVETG